MNPTKMADKKSRTHPVTVLLCVCCIQMIFAVPLPRFVTDTGETSRGEEGELFEGDILLPSVDYSSRGKRMVHDMPMEGSGDEDVINMEELAGNLWTDRKVHYRFDSKISPYLRSLFADAINALQGATCLEFIELDSNGYVLNSELEREKHHAYLNFTDKLGCSSYVGKINKMQEVSITLNCANEGHAIHEIGHAIGLFHEHTRTDRDEYIQIKWENMHKKYEENFKVYSHHNTTKDVEYDFESIMHYPQNAFAKEKNLQTIVLKDDVDLPDCIKKAKIGQRQSLSYKDKLRINKMYKCHDFVKSLEEEGDKCPLEPTPSPSSPTPSPTTPPTTPPAPTCQPIKTIATGDEISLTIVESNKSNDEDNLICTPNGCTKTDCSDWRTDCFDRRKKAWKIHMTKNRRNNLIKSGYEVALFDKWRKQWLDCSRNEGCKLTHCDTVDDYSNLTKEICSVHHLKLFAADRRDSTRVKTTDLFYIKSGEKFLNCNERNCKLVTEGSADCMGSEESSGSSSGSECTRTFFRIHREVEQCRQ